MRTSRSVGTKSTSGPYLFLTPVCPPILEMSLTYLQLFIASLLSTIVYRLLQRRQRQPLPFPPGPKGLPLIGNLRDLPPEYQWLKYEKLGQDIGTHL
jgi:hypothetical protein